MSNGLSTTTSPIDNNCYIYIRYDSDDQFPLELQEKECIDYTVQHSLKIHNIFKDKDIDENDKIELRPELSTCISYLKEGDTIIIYSVRRISDNRQILDEFLEQIDELKCKVIFICENIDTSMPMYKYLLSCYMTVYEEQLRLFYKKDRGDHILNIWNIKKENTSIIELVKITNPKTGRQIDINGKAYKALLKEGYKYDINTGTWTNPKK